MTWYLGWDCANRTLAYTLMKYDRRALDCASAELNDFAAAITAQPSEELFRRFDDIKRQLKQSIIVERADVVDLLGANIKTFTPVELSRALKTFLDNSPVSAAAMMQYAPTVIIEYQPPKLARWGGATTEQASTIAHQLMFYYSD